MELFLKKNDDPFELSSLAQSMPDSNSFEAIYQKNLLVTGKDSNMIESDSMGSIVKYNMQMTNHTNAGLSLSEEVDLNQTLILKAEVEKTSPKEKSPHSSSHFKASTNLVKTGSSFSVRNLTSLFEKPSKNESISKPFKILNDIGKVKSFNHKSDDESHEHKSSTDEIVFKVKDRVSNFNLKIESQIVKNKRASSCDNKLKSNKSPENPVPRQLKLASDSQYEETKRMSGISSNEGKYPKSIQVVEEKPVITPIKVENQESNSIKCVQSPKLDHNSNVITVSKPITRDQINDVLKKEFEMFDFMQNSDDVNMSKLSRDLSNSIKKTLKEST